MDWRQVSIMLPQQKPIKPYPVAGVIQRILLTTAIEITLRVEHDCLTGSWHLRFPDGRE
jgi:hypothetical protein